MLGCIPNFQVQHIRRPTINVLSTSYGPKNAVHKTDIYMLFNWR